MTRLLLPCLLISAALLSACGGSNGGSTAAPAPTADKLTGVAGPLDPVQTAVSEQAFAPLIDAVAGTPLEAVLQCTNQLVTFEVIDTADLVANGLTGSSGSPVPAPADLVGRVRAISFDLTQLLLALGDQGSGCLVGGNSLIGNADAFAFLENGQNPLDGTPLAPLGAIVGPVLARVIEATGGDTPRPDLPLATLVQLYGQLNTALQSGLDQLPAEVTTAPVVGGALLTTGEAFDDLGAVLASLVTASPSSIQLAIDQLLNRSLDNLLTRVLPVAALEDAAGQPGLISGPINTATAELTARVATLFNGSSAGDLGLSALFEGALDPIVNAVLPGLIGPIIIAFEDGLPGGIGLPGTPLDGAVILITETLETLLGNTGDLGCALSGLPLLGSLCNS